MMLDKIDHARMSDKAFREHFGMSREDYQAAYGGADDGSEPPAWWRHTDAHGHYWWQCLFAAARVSGYNETALLGRNMTKLEPDRRQIQNCKDALCLLLDADGYTVNEIARALSVSPRTVQDMLKRGDESDDTKALASEIRAEAEQNQ